MENRYYVAGFQGQGAKYMLYDLEKMDNCTLIGDIWGKNSIVGKIHKAYDERKERDFYKRIYRILIKSKVLRTLYYKSFELSKVEFDKEKCNYILFINSGLCAGYTKNFLLWLKKNRSNIKLILYIVDPTDIFFRDFCNRDVWEVFERIYNINAIDCEKYGHKYWPLVLSKVKMEGDDKSVEKKNGLYFCGFGPDRFKMLKEIVKECNVRNISFNFMVYYFTNVWKDEDIKFIDKPISYMENLQNIQECDCILELMHDGYANQTQRYPEAVIYNKKLLTNNENIQNYPYYDERYMKIFHTIDDIDWQWLAEKIEVNYYYKGDFSPTFLLHDFSEC